MENSNLSELYEKFLNNNITSAEVEILLLHFRIADEAELQELIALGFAWEDEPVIATLAEQANIQSILQSIKASTHQGQPKLGMRLIYQIAIAASILIVCSIAALIYKRYSLPEQNIVATNDVMPGTNQAILTLANGQKISLSSAKNGNLAATAGASIAKTADGKLVYSNLDKNRHVLNYDMLSTPRGGQHFIQLSDGTRVWLNAESTLKFPESFKGQKQRQVYLQGEAYFEVAKMQVPFIVKTIKQDVEVLGTHFNINAYGNELAVKTTLLEGSVKISLPSLKEQSPHDTIIKPGEQAITIADHTEVSNADLRAAIDWKNGDFNFKKGEDFRVAMRKLERWYNVEMVYDNSVSDKIDLGGWLSRKLSLNTVLERISSTGKVQFKIEGRRVRVTK